MATGNAIRDARAHRPGEIAHRAGEVCATFYTYTRCQPSEQRRAEADAFARKWGGRVEDRMIRGQLCSVVIAAEDWVY